MHFDAEVDIYLHILIQLTLGKNSVMCNNNVVESSLKCSKIARNPRTISSTCQLEKSLSFLHSYQVPICADLSEVVLKCTKMAIDCD